MLVTKTLKKTNSGEKYILIFETNAKARVICKSYLKGRATVVIWNGSMSFSSTERNFKQCINNEYYI